MEITTRMETSSVCGFTTRSGSCGVPRASHRNLKNTRHHKYQPTYPKDFSQNNVLTGCRCGTEAFVVREPDEPLLLPVAKRLMETEGWRVIESEWRCPFCTKKFDKRQAAKADPRQASFI